MKETRARKQMGLPSLDVWLVRSPSFFREILPFFSLHLFFLITNNAICFRIVAEVEGYSSRPLPLYPDRLDRLLARSDLVSSRRRLLSSISLRPVPFVEAERDRM